MPTPTLGYENVARIQPKKRLPAADGGQCLSIYFFSGTPELGPRPHADEFWHRDVQRVCFRCSARANAVQRPLPPSRRGMPQTLQRTIKNNHQLTVSKPRRALSPPKF